MTDRQAQLRRGISDIIRLDDDVIMIITLVIMMIIALMIIMIITLMIMMIIPNHNSQICVL